MFVFFPVHAGFYQSVQHFALFISVPNQDSSSALSNGLATTKTPPSQNTTSDGIFDPGGDKCDPTPTENELVITIQTMRYTTLAISVLFLIEVSEFYSHIHGETATTYECSPFSPGKYGYLFLCMQFLFFFLLFFFFFFLFLCIIGISHFSACVVNRLLCENRNCPKLFK